MKGQLMKMAKLVIALIWLALFFYQTSFILAKWMAQETATSIQYIHNKRLQLPYLTLCSRKAYKCRMNNITEETYANCTYSFEELFPRKKRNAPWHVTSFRSNLIGQCYTLHHPNEVKPLETTLSIGLANGTDMILYGRCK